MSNTKGFTLIELLVVIAIIGVLATGAVTVFSGATQKANDAARLADMSTMNSAINIFNADNASYPDGTDRAAFVGDLVPGFLQSVPSDPEDGEATGMYEYNYGTLTAEVTAPQSFELTAALEHSSNDTKEDSDGGGQSDTYEIGTNLALLIGDAVGGATGLTQAADANSTMAKL